MTYMPVMRVRGGRQHVIVTYRPVITGRRD